MRSTPRTSAATRSMTSIAAWQAFCVSGGGPGCSTLVAIRLSCWELGDARRPGRAGVVGVHKRADDVLVLVLRERPAVVEVGGPRKQAALRAVGGGDLERLHGCLAAAKGPMESLGALCRGLHRDRVVGDAGEDRLHRPGAFAAVGRHAVCAVSAGV